MTSYLDRFTLYNKIAVVCGGLGLIGKEISKSLAQVGAKVIIIDIDEKRFKSCTDFYFGLDITFIKFDISKIEKYGQLLASINKDYGPINILINVAYPKTEDWGEKFENVRLKSWRKNVDIQMNSSCFMTKAMAELMKKNNVKGSIVNFGSTYGVVGPDFNIYKNTKITCPAAYSAIKGGIINFTRYVASFYGKYGIRINCICPGGVYNNQPKQFVKEYNKKAPLGRMASPDEIAAATLFLASGASSYITGAILMVDGGWTCI